MQLSDYSLAQFLPVRPHCKTLMQPKELVTTFILYLKVKQYEAQKVHWLKSLKETPTLMTWVQIPVLFSVMGARAVYLSPAGLGSATTTSWDMKANLTVTKT